MAVGGPGWHSSGHVLPTLMRLMSPSLTCLQRSQNLPALSTDAGGTEPLPSGSPGGGLLTYSTLELEQELEAMLTESTGDGVAGNQ